MPDTSIVNRQGINISVGIRTLGNGESYSISDTTYYATKDDSYFIDNLLIANNTVVIDNDRFENSSGDYYGLKLKKIKNARIVNNAIEMADTSKNILTDSRYAAAIYYQGPPPSEANNTIDYNIYSYNSLGSTTTDCYRFVYTETTGKVVDLGYKNEYNTLNNWQNWMKTDLFSNSKSFMKDLNFIYRTGSQYPILRVKRNPSPINSPLDRAGVYLAEAEVDIDGNRRNYADQRLDIGAELVMGERFASDMQVLNINTPGTYKANRGPFSDAEYFMVEDKPITVKAFIRNNGNAVVSNKEIKLRVYEEPVLTNNFNADVFTTNYTQTFINNERALYTSIPQFQDIQ